MTTSYIYEFLTVSVLLFLTTRVEAVEPGCKEWVGTTRDCTCGARVKDFEEICQDESTYFQPKVWQERRVCDFKCENGGMYDEQRNMCICPQGYHGLCCQIEAKSSVCGDLLLGPSGTIQSHLRFSKGRPYPRNLRCVWRITTDPQRRIALGVKDNKFDIQGGNTLQTCDHDSLTIYDGKTNSSLNMGSYCGKNGMRKLETVYSTNEHLYIEFKSDADHSGNAGFELHYTTFLKNRECGPRKVYSLETGIITSPNYPVSYKANDECEYEIQPLPDQDIVLTFLEINMKAKADCSSGDRIVLTVRNDTLHESRTLTTFCRRGPIAPYTIVKPSGSVFLTFISNNKYGGTFKLRYNQVPSEVSILEVASS